MRQALYMLVQVTWGLPQALVGALIFLVTPTNESRFRFHGAIVTTWGRREGLSMGPFIFLPRRASRRLLVHEYGHTIQSLILGPTYLPVMVLPSLIWAGLPLLKRRRELRGTSYYSFYTERTADALGERVTGERSMGTDCGV